MGKFALIVVALLSCVTSSSFSLFAQKRVEGLEANNSVLYA